MTVMAVLWMLIATMAVAMVTAAPVATDEKGDNSVAEDSTIDRAKRAEEEIYFGNQQNKARAMVKKSGSDPAPPVQADPSADLGGDVVAHAQVPVEQAVIDRAEAALDRVEDDKQTAAAMEAAMQSAAENVLDSDQKVDTSEEGGDGEEDIEDAPISEPTGGISEEDSSPDSATFEVQSEGDVANPDVTGSDDSAEEQELLEAAAEAQSSAVKEVPSESSPGDVISDDATPSEAADESSLEPSDEVDDILQELKDSEAVRPIYQVAVGNDGMSPPSLGQDSGDKDGYNPYSQLLMPRYGDPSVYPFMYYPRQRRSLHPRRRRIKRDLLDDQYGYPPPLYSSEYPQEDKRSPYDRRSSPPSDGEIDYMYRVFLNILEENYLKKLAEQYIEESEDEEELPYEPRYLPEEELDDGRDSEEEEDLYEPEEEASPYAVGYVYDPEDSEGRAFRRSSKRSSYLYPEILNKRYFYPFSDEPETHWGAFVPEKRGYDDYDDAVQRLQRLALALGDNHGPLYRELIENYRKR